MKIQRCDIIPDCSILRHRRGRRHDMKVMSDVSEDRILILGGNRLQKLNNRR
jgi:hypothetical protein